MNQPTRREAYNVSRVIPDDPGTVTFDVERSIVNTGSGERVVKTEFEHVFMYRDILRREKRTITVTTTPWVTVETGENE